LKKTFDKKNENRNSKNKSWGSRENSKKKFESKATDEKAIRNGFKGRTEVKEEAGFKNRVEVKEESDFQNYIEGRNAVIEALRADKNIEHLLISKGNTEGSINVIMAIAKEKKIVVKIVEKQKLNSISETGMHQGVIAVVTPYEYFEVEDILKVAKERKEDPFILILDEIEDPHNLGSIIRSAECCGVHGVIIPKRRGVGVTSTVYRCSAGAIEHVKVAKVANINQVIDELKKAGIWVYGADAGANSYVYNTNFKGGVALVIGSEGKGISKLTQNKCDKLIKIPMRGKLNSLNASVASGIIVYEIMKQKISGREM
jgi:23S rRNA (guanosine2251-2'-O)-methyltransferase